MNDIDLILCHVVSQTGFSTIQCTYNMHNVYIYIYIYTYVYIYKYILYTYTWSYISLLNPHCLVSLFHCMQFVIISKFIILLCSVIAVA